MNLNTTRKTAVVTGVVFIIATVAALLAALLTPVLTNANYLTLFSEQTKQVSIGAIFYLIAAFTSVGIAILLYPVLKVLNLGLALASVVFRTLEAAFYMVAIVSLMSLLTLSKHYVVADGVEHSLFKTMGDSLVSFHDHAMLMGVFAFCLGAFMYYYLFFQSRLVPRWLSGWGILAIILMGTACVLSLFSDNPVTGYTILVLPIALQEMVLAVWLIVKGFISHEPEMPLETISMKE